MAFGGVVFLVYNRSERHLLNNHTVLFHFFEALTSTEATAERECGLCVVRVSVWMRHSERAIDTVAVTQLNFLAGRLTVLVVAPVAEVVRAKTMPKSNRAAEHAFPVDLLFTMFFTVLLAGAVRLDLAVFAAQIFFICLLFYAELCSTVDHATEVRLLTVKALIESA